MQPGAGEYQELGQLATGCRGAGCSVVKAVAEVVFVTVHQNLG